MHVLTTLEDLLLHAALVFLCEIWITPFAAVLLADKKPSHVLLKVTVTAEIISATYQDIMTSNIPPLAQGFLQNLFKNNYSILNTS